MHEKLTEAGFVQRDGVDIRWNTWWWGDDTAIYLTQHLTQPTALVGIIQDDQDIWLYQGDIGEAIGFAVKLAGVFGKYAI